MSIFRREPDRPSRDDPEPMARPVTRPPEPRTARGPSRSTLVAEGTRIQGEIHGSADLSIEGEFQGNIDLESEVVVQPQGKVSGEIVARSVRIGGRVQGDVRGRDLVELQASGSLEGNVSAARVVIAEGAFFKGKVEMTGDKSGKGSGTP